jgi:DNA-directed RNA polymerase specialized sigma24 family protein
VALTEALRERAPEAFGALYDEHAGQLYAYCHLMVGDEAADAVCDAFVAIARHPDSVPADEDTLPAWLHALARAECVRRGALVRTPATTAPWSSNPVWRALAGLSPEDREVLVLATALVPEEIAVVLGVPWDTAETLVQVARRRLEHAPSSEGGPEAQVRHPLDEVTLRRMLTSLYEPPERERERTLSSCAAAEYEPGGTLAFDADGMPVMPDAPSENADEPAHTPTEDPRGDADTGPPPSWEDSPEPRATDDEEPAPVTRDGRAEGRRESTASRPGRRPAVARARRIEGLLQVLGLAALVLVAVGVMAVRADRSGGSSGEGGTGLPVHRKATASPSVRPAAPALPPRTVPSPLPATAPPNAAPADTGTPVPPGGSDPAYPIPPPSYPAPPAPPSHSRPPEHHPTSPADPAPTPTPSDSPTGKGSRSPAPHPSGL